MAITIVNAYTTTTTGFGTSLSQTITAPASGNTLLIMAGADNTGTNFSSVTTNLGATATVDFVGSNNTVHYCRFSNVTTGPTTITVNASAADLLFIWVFEVSGLANAAPSYSASLAANSPGFGTAFNFTAVPPVAGELALGSLVEFSSGGPLSTISPTYTIPTTPMYGIGPFYGPVATAGSQTVDITVGSSTGSAVLDFVTYAAAPPPGVPVYYVTV